MTTAPPRSCFANTGAVAAIAIYAILSTIGMFSGGIWAIGGIALALILAAFRTMSERRFCVPDYCLAGLAFAALGFMALSSAWSITPAASLYESLRLATIFLPLMLLTGHKCHDQAASKYFFPIVAIAMATGALALGLELKFGGPLQKALHHGQVELTKYNRGLTYAILLAFPVMAWIKSQASCQSFPSIFSAFTARFKHREITLALFVAALLFPASLTESRAGKLALVAGLAVALASSIGPRLVAKALLFLPVLLTGWPYAARTLFMALHDKLGAIPASWQHRMEIWDYMSWRILERPLLGWGIGTSHVLPFQEPHGSLYEYATAPALHPHNAVTELWVELGIPGLALGLLFSYWALRKANRLSPALVPFAFGSWTAALCLSLTAYNFWTDSLFAAFALTGFAFSLLDAKLRGEILSYLKVSRSKRQA